MKKLILISALLFLLSGMMLTTMAGRTSDDSPRLMEIYARADSTIRIEGNYPEALDLYLSFIRGAEGNKSLEAQLLKAYLSVAVIYGSFNDDDHAIIYNRLAYPLARKLSDTKFSELALTNLAQSYRSKRDFDNAARTADSLLNLDFRDSRTLIFHYSIIKGELALQLGKNAEAMAHFLRADSAANASNLSPYEKSAPLELLAAYYERVNKPDSQLIYLNRAWELIEKNVDPQPKAECARLLMKFHTEQGNMEEARKFQTAYFNLTDSLVNLQHFLSVSTRHQQSQIDSKGIEIDILNKKALYHKTIIAVIASFLVLAIAAIIIIIRQKRHLDAAYKALFEKDRRLIGITHEDTARVREEAGDATACEDSAASDTSCDTVPEEETDAREEERNRALYNKIVKTMETTDEYLNPDFGLSNLVAIVGSNVAYVSKVVKLYSGQNVPSFINEYRIREACRLILDEEHFGNITFAAIGESVGFSSQVSFNRAFKKVTGITPSFYQKMAAAERRNGRQSSNI